MSLRRRCASPHRRRRTQYRHPSVANPNHHGTIITPPESALERVRKSAKARHGTAPADDRRVLQRRCSQPAISCLNARSELQSHGHSGRRSRRAARHACTTSRQRNVVFANTASAGFAVHVSINAESKVTQDAVTLLLVAIGGCERPCRTPTHSPPFLWIAKQAAPLLLSKSVVGGTAVRQRNLHRTPPEVEKSRTSTQSRAPSDTNKKYTTPGMPTPKPRQCVGHCHPTPGSAPRQHPAVRRACSIAAGQDVKVFEEGDLTRHQLLHAAN